MRSLIIASLLIIACQQVVAQAQDRKFPYEAIVEVEGEYIRSGPGPSFYPTDKMRKGSKVTVHRHDPGGWCMISPPAGSFSWIKAEHVQRSGESNGVLKANNVVVHVGSSLSSDEFTTIQGNLSKGDAVQILGEKNFPFDDGQKLMYKISPIRREWRWIQRKSIVAADEIQNSPFPGEPTPRKKPSGPVADQIEIDPDAFTQPISTGETVTGPGSSLRNSNTRTGSTPNTINPEATNFADRLDTIDRQFREMIKQQEPSSWDLKDIERQYSQLDNDATQPSQSKTIALRLDAVSRYEKMQNEYLNFLKVSDEAKQRDAQLAALQRDAEQRAITGGPTQPAATPTPNPVTPQPRPQMTPQPAGGDAIASAGSNVSAGTGAPANAPKFAGAGMVVPMAQTFPGGPQFALVAPGGKLLAYLVPASGVDLKRAANQSMGIIGDRSFRQDWGADVIMVRGLQPVQLRASR